jgi:hypothetical protein
LGGLFESGCEGENGFLGEGGIRLAWFMLAAAVKECPARGVGLRLKESLFLI